MTKQQLQHLVYLTGTGIIIAAITLISIFSDKPPAQLSLTESVDITVVNSITASKMYADIQNRVLKAKDVDFTAQEVELPGKTLGSTEVQIISSEPFKIRIIIRLDLYKIHSYKEVAEPVVAHELKHAHDAIFGNVLLRESVDMFLSKVERDKNLPWEQRENEKSAMATEDLVRKELKDTGNPRYAKMASSRLEAIKRMSVKERTGLI